METYCELSLKMQTLKGVHEYGCFNLGNDVNFAKQLYQELAGSTTVTHKTIMTIDLIKWKDGIPFTLAMRHCNYEQLSNNVKLITKALFKQYNLEP